MSLKQYFLHFYMILGGNTRQQLPMIWHCVFSLCLAQDLNTNAGFSQPWRVVRFQSSIMRVMRRDTWGLCPSFIHLISRHFPNFLQWARTNSLKARLDMRDNRKYITISLPSVYYLFIYIFKIL